MAEMLNPVLLTSLSFRTKCKHATHLSKETLDPVLTPTRLNTQLPTPVPQSHPGNFKINLLFDREPLQFPEESSDMLRSLSMNKILTAGFCWS